MRDFFLFITIYFFSIWLKKEHYNPYKRCISTNKRWQLDMCDDCFYKICQKKYFELRKFVETLNSGRKWKFVFQTKNQQILKNREKISWFFLTGSQNLYFLQPSAKFFFVATGSQWWKLRYLWFRLSSVARSCEVWTGGASASHFPSFQLDIVIQR